MKLFAMLLVFLGFIALLIGLGALLSLPVMWLVNYLFSASLLTSVFGTAKIGFYQAWALNCLTGFLFGSRYKGSNSK